ncbi:MAG: hypothetical protein FD127_4077, partial [Acidimicrobiaceae bacterium]
SLRAVKTHLHVLETEGWLVVVERGGLKGEHRRANSYQARDPRTAPMHEMHGSNHPDDRAPVQEMHGSHTTNNPQPMHEVHGSAPSYPEPVHEVHPCTNSTRAPDDAYPCTSRRVPVQEVHPISSRTLQDFRESAHARDAPRPRAPIPPEFKPPPHIVQQLADEGRSARLQAAEFPKFVDHARANDRRVVDWDAAYSLWIRRAKPDQLPRAARFVCTNCGAEEAHCECGYDAQFTIEIEELG